MTLPADLSKRLRTITTGLRRPFGSIRVRARSGGATWETSLFADTRRNAFLLPRKADARRKAGIKAGDEVEVEIRLEH